mmetsp:Transcript_54773/g.75912  ORF Transcript_54773/g.75912 Transcript_54773/m.75912 type:complete len:394 (-) Transcript_54773:450-1631(-)
MIQGVGVGDVLVRAALAVLLEHLLVAVPICLAVLVELVDWVHRVDQRVLVRRFVAEGSRGIREVASKNAASPHFVLNIGHVHGLVRLCVALLVHRQQLHHALVACFPEFPRMVVHIVPLLHKATCTRPSREGSETLGVHSCGVRGHDPPEVAVDHIPHLVGHGMELVHTGVPNQSEGFTDVAHVLQLFATREVQGLGTTSRQGVHSVLQQPVGMRQEGDIANTEATALLDLAIGLTRTHHRIELEGVLDACALVHRLELVQQLEGRCGVWTLVAEPAGKTWAKQALPSRDDVDLGSGILHAASHVLHCEGAIAQNRSASILHSAIVPDEESTLAVSHAIADLSTGGDEFVLTRIVDDAIDVIGTREVVHERDLDTGSGRTHLARRAVATIAAT